jgi:hypothetical protein
MMAPMGFRHREHQAVGREVVAVALRVGMRLAAEVDPRI